MMTGTGEATIFSMISRVDSTRPPGVLISMRTAWSLFLSAAARARATYSAVTGWMASSSWIFRTSAEETVARNTETITAKRIRGRNEWSMLLLIADNWWL